jgi:uncharacterized protein involved in propanediol utilization
MNNMTSARRARQADCVDVSTATGMSIAQHGEILQGQLEDFRCQRRRFLLSLPCDLLYSRVTFEARPACPLVITPVHKDKARKAVELTLRRFKREDVGGLIFVETNIDEGKGYGSSTADCIASALAAARAIGRPLAEEELAEVVVEAEIASDNFMFKRPVLFAHREGVVLEDLGPSLPKLEVLGLDTDADGVVYTLDFPPAVYNWRQIQCFHTLVSALRRAIRCRDIRLLGRVATASAVTNQEFLPKPMFNEIRRLAEHASALGIAVAHSGTILSILLDPSDPSLEPKVHQLRKELETMGITKVVRFRT